MAMKTIATAGLLLLGGVFLAACVNGGAGPAGTGPASASVTEGDVFEASLVENGREIAEQNCAVCHSIEKTGASPREGVPPLRIALAGFDIEALATDFREHIQVGNDVMPEFSFSPLHTDALMAYLLTIETVPADG